MQKHRATLLLAVLLGLVGFYVLQSQQPLMLRHVVADHEEALDGENEIRNISVSRDKFDGYVVEVDYRFRERFGAGLLRVYALQTPELPRPKGARTSSIIKRGVNKVTVPLWRDSSDTIAHSTRIVRVEMVDAAKNEVVASRDLEYPIDWPRLGYSPEPAQDTRKDIDTLYKEAVAEIDYSTKDSLKNARVKLELILSKDARYVAVYPELARYHMKTNWGPEGLRQAERVLKSGLAIDPDHANSHVLIGYVFAHQGRYQDAEEALRKAERIGTDNLWLWSNWGELYLMQGRVPESIAMYTRAVAGTRPYNTYDRARKDAYKHLIDMHTLGNDMESADALHLKRIAEYGSEACFPYYYAEFRQRNFDDVDRVLEYARKALDAGCRYESRVRKVIATAYYSKWIAATTPEERQSYITQARLLFAEGPKLIYWLAQSEKTAPIIQGIIGNGISIDVADNDGVTALAYAVKEDDLDAVKRLIDLGGNTNATVGKQNIPLLAIAVIGNSKESVKYLVSNGADVNAEINEGASMLDLAEGLGYDEIAEVLRSADGRRI